MAKRRRSMKAAPTCMPGDCPGGAKHVVSLLAGYGLLLYGQTLLGVPGNLWLSSLGLLVLAYLAMRWCPAYCKCCGK